MQSTLPLDQFASLIELRAVVNKSLPFDLKKLVFKCVYDHLMCLQQAFHVRWCSKCRWLVVREVGSCSLVWHRLSSNGSFSEALSILDLERKRATLSSSQVIGITSDWSIFQGVAASKLVSIQLNSSNYDELIYFSNFAHCYCGWWTLLVETCSRDSRPRATLSSSRFWWILRMSEKMIAQTGS